MATYLETQYMKDEYSEEAYPQKLYHDILNHLIRHHLGYIQNKCLLDEGSGKGNYLVAFSRREMSAFGLDKIKEKNEVLAHFDVRECDFEKGQFPYETNSFDVVFSKSVIEYVANAGNFLAEIHRVLKPRGLAIVMTPDWVTQAHMFWDDYTHVKPWTRKGLQNAMKIHGFLEVHSTLFRQLRKFWKFPKLEILADVVASCPELWKWKDIEQTRHREWIRFSKEKMLLATAVK